VRRYATRQLDERPDDVIADPRDAFAQADALGYTSWDHNRRRPHTACRGRPPITRVQHVRGQDT
jgi:hypothetical protein